MNILMVSSETVPFSKSGGLADVVGALSTQLSALGHETSVFMPLYGSIDRKGFKKECSFTVSTLKRKEKVDIFSKTLDGVKYLGLSHPLFTQRKGIYGDSSFTPYPDNCYRYALMCQAAVHMAGKLDVDILHAHDWTAGPSLYLAKLQGLKCRTVFTIHNLAYMGLFPRYDLLRTAIRPSDRMFEGWGLERKINFLRTGLEYADRITTVSPTYAKEIQTREQGCGLDWLMREKAPVLDGILNGIDIHEWNPETDSFIPFRFNADTLEEKEKVKASVQEQFGLEVRSDIPLFAMISRLAEQKGFGPLLEGSNCALERILSAGRCQFLIIGTGDRRYEERLKAIASSYKNISVNIVFSQALSHLVEAGADFFLMPSRYEPCGLNQMYSLRYGTIPVAHRTGGLNDTIVDISTGGENGNGFLFDNVYSDEIVSVVNRAIDFYQDKGALHQARVNGMKCDFSWLKSAYQYESIYMNALGGNQT